MIVYSNKPQVVWSGCNRLTQETKVVDNPQSKFPARARDIQSAPTDTSTPIVLWSAGEKPAWGCKYLGQWHEVTSGGRDPRTGAQLPPKFSGRIIHNPLKWSSS